MAEESDHLAALVPELQDKVADLAGAAGMWQTRAEVPGMQLDQARSELRALRARSSAGSPCRLPWDGAEVRLRASRPWRCS